MCLIIIGGQAERLQLLARAYKVSRGASRAWNEFLAVFCTVCEAKIDFTLSFHFFAVIISCFFPVTSKEELRNVYSELLVGHGEKDGIILLALMVRLVAMLIKALGLLVIVVLVLFALNNISISDCIF